MKTKTNNVAKFSIKFPRWIDKTVGLAEYRLKDSNEVEILYEDVNGVRLFPHKYTITKNKAMSFPTQIVGEEYKVKVRLIPISELTIEESINEQ